MSNQLWHPSGKYFCKQCLVVGYFINEICWNRNIMTSKNLEIFLTYQHFHPQVSQKFRRPTLCQVDHSYHIKGNVFFHLIFYACHVSSAASSSGTCSHIAGIVWVRYHCTGGRAVPAMPNHQEKEENSTLRDHILWFFNVKRKQAEISCFESFILFVGTQLLLLESHNWSQKRFVYWLPIKARLGDNEKENFFFQAFEMGRTVMGHTEDLTPHFPWRIVPAPFALMRTVKFSTCEDRDPLFWNKTPKQSGFSLNFWG